MKTIGEKLTRTAPGKALCTAVFALACFVGAVCAAGAIFAARYECYSDSVGSYYDTQNFETRIQNMAQDVMAAYAADGMETDGWRYEADQTNLRFRISEVSADGAVGKSVYSTYDGTETEYGIRYYFSVLAGGAYKAQIIAGRDGIREDGTLVVPAAPNESLLGSSAGPAEEPAEAQTDAPAAEAAEADAAGQRQNDGAGKLYLLELDVTNPITVRANYARGLKDNYDLFNTLYAWRTRVFAWMAVCAAAGLCSLALLLTGAGRKAGYDGIAECWFDRIPMELSFLGLCLCCAGAGAGTYIVSQLIGRANNYNGLPLRQEILANVCLIAAFLVVCLLALLAWVLAFARAAKTGHAFRNFLLARLAGWLAGAVRRLPLAPRAAVIIAAFGGVNFLLLLAAFVDFQFLWFEGVDYLVLLPFLWFVAAAAAVYLAAGFQTLHEGARRIAAGDYTGSIDPRGMPEPLRAHAEVLQNIGAGLNTAVEQRTKSERMKAELITNVSHDLKTPLTSIINYTDLLQSQPLPEKAAEYAAVLARQGARLKKLTEDLVEASKASSGAMTCEKTPTSLTELCDQALGEYSYRLERAELTPVLTMPEDGLWANVDGRLVWRILDNLLGNACKYAQPGTRVYVMGAAQAGEAVIAVKNISREALNITADELMERFVRGDSSRSSEGSGLGLSIARSLCELQGGRFGLTVDGDLFKAEMRFARCAAPKQPAEARSGGEEQPGALDADFAPAEQG